jgi:PAS domain S-box-containing protein
MGRRLRALIVEDRRTDAELIMFELERAGFEVEAFFADSEASYLAQLDDTVEIILSDYSLPDMNAPRALELLQRSGFDIPFVIITGRATEEQIVECMRQGAVDYLIKDRLGRLGSAVLRALEEKTQRVEKSRIEDAARREREFSRNLVQGSLTGILAFDCERRYTQWNPAMERLTGVSCEDAFGKRAHELFPFAVESGIEAAHTAALRGESTTVSELAVFLPQSERQVVLEAQYSPLFNDERQIIGGLGFVQDVTDRKQASEALERSEWKFRALIENSSDVIAVVDEHGTIRYVSPSAERVFGYSIEELVGRNVFWHVHPDDAPHLMQTFVPVAEQPSTHARAEFRFLRRDQTWRTLETVGRNLLGDPAVNGIVLNARDITDRKHAEEELRFRLELENIIADVSTQFINLEPDEIENGISAALRNVSSFLGVDRGYVFQFDTKPDLLKLVHQWHRDGVASLPDIYHVVRHDGWPWLSEQLQSGHYVYYSPDHPLPAQAVDELRYVEEYALQSMIVLPMAWRGVPVGFLGFEVMQTETKRLAVAPSEPLQHHMLPPERLHQAGIWSEDLIALMQVVAEIIANGLERRYVEAALRESESRYRVLVQTSPDAILLIDINGDIVMCNQQKALMHGYNSPEELVGLNAREFVAPQDHPRMYNDITQILQTGGIRDTEYIMQRRDGSNFIAELSASLISDEQGQPRAIAVVFRDITQRKQTELNVRRQLERTLALRNIDMAITASLDLQVTLNVIVEQVLSQLQLDATCVLLFNPQNEDLEYAVGRGFRTNVLQYTRLQLGQGYAGRVALRRERLMVSNLNEQAGEFARAPSLEDEDFVTYFGVPLLAKGKVVGVLEVFQRSHIDPDVDWLNFLEIFAGQAAIAIDNARLLEDLQQSNQELNLAYDTTLEGWSRALDLRDKETEGHTQRVTEYTLALASRFNLNESEMLHIRRGALLHDIGKMGIPDSILLKPGKLTDEEWVIMKKHPVFARDLLYPIQYLRPSLEIPYCHHEKWDGSGYPENLKGEEIPLSARIFAVIDVWDALRSDRPYRQGWPADKVLQHIRDGAGSHFDPQVVAVFEQMDLVAMERHLPMLDHVD